MKIIFFPQNENFFYSMKIFSFYFIECTLFFVTILMKEVGGKTYVLF